MQQRVLTLEKSILLLEAVFASNKGIGTRPLAKLLDENIATVHNIAMTLCHLKYLQQDAKTKVFYPGLRLMVFSRHPTYRRSLLQTGAPIIDAVAEKINESTLLAVIDSGRVINLKYAPGRQALRAHESDDMSDHAYATAVGKVLLASLTEAELDDYLARNPMQKLTDNTLRDAKSLKAELAVVRKQRYARTVDEFCEGLSAMAVPVYDLWGNILAGIGCSAPTVRLQKPAQVKLTLAALQGAASELEKAWGDALHNTFQAGDAPKPGEVAALLRSPAAT